MVRIPRTEQAVGFQPAMMPGTSGEAYAAPGRAMQGLGNAISGLGAALDAKAEQENEYGDKLRMLKWSNEVDLENLKRQGAYNGDGTGYTADTQQWYKDQESRLYDGMSPKGRQKAALFIEGKRGTVVEGAQRFETHRRNETMYSSTKAAITSEFGKLSQLPSEQMEQGAATALKGINSIIEQNPLGEPAKELLRDHAAKLYEATIIKALPDGAKAQGAKSLIEQWRKTLPQEPVPATPGPQSSGKDYIIEKQQGATRSKPISGDLRGVLNYAAEQSGVTVEVYSGGQDATGSKRTGSHRHDHGNAADLKIMKDGQPVDFTTPEGQKIYQQFVSAAAAAGATGIGAGEGYMGTSSIHVGFGKEATWGSGGKGTNAPEWLRQSYAAGRAAPVKLGAPANAPAETGIRTSQAGIDAIKRFEGDKDQGWDYRQYSGPYGVKRGANERLTLPEAEARMKQEVAKVEADMAAKIKAPLTQSQHDALASLFYNIGTGKGRLDEVAGLINAGKADQVPNWIRQFTKAGGSELPGLVKRRDAEAQMFASGAGTKVASLGGEVPQPTNTEPPSKITEVMKGTAEEKAAKLRELIAKGYQDVVHQLDSDGNDVIIAKKSQKPVWQRGVRGKNADGTIPNELDRPDFAGPGWANGVVEDLKAGKIRPENTIPGGTQVAQAPPRYRSSVETKLMESLQKKLPALQADDIAAVGRLVDRAEKVASEGAILPADERKITERAILATGDKQLAERYSLASQAAAETYMLRAARPDRIKDVAVSMRAEIAQSGGEATPEQLAKVSAVEKLAKHVDEKLDKDMLGWGQEIGIIPQLPALDPANPKPEALAAYSQAAAYMGARYGRPPQVFSQSQAEAVAEQFKRGGPGMLDMLGKYTVGLGPPMMAQAMKQIAPKAPEAAIAGYLYGNNINQAAAKDIAATLHRRADPNYKGHDVKRADTEATAESVLGDALKTYPPEQRDALLKAADAIYENRVTGSKAASFQTGDYEKALRDVIGQRTNAKGVVFGGAVPQDSILGQFKKNYVMIPPTWRQDTLKTTLETVSADELKAAGLPVPVTADGKPVNAVRLANKGKLVPIGNGLGTYAVAMGDPATPGKEDFLMAAPFNPRDDRQTLPRQPFVLDLTKLEPVLRKRLPSAFWGE